MFKEDVENNLIGSIQVIQNKLARFLTGKKLMDKIPTKEIFNELKIPSVNQINAQIKLLEVWKSQQSDSYRTQWRTRNDAALDRRTRASKENLLHESYGCNILNSTFINDAARVWNLAPNSIKISTSISAATKKH